MYVSISIILSDESFVCSGPPEKKMGIKASNTAEASETNPMP